MRLSLTRALKVRRGLRPGHPCAAIHDLASARHRTCGIRPPNAAPSRLGMGPAPVQVRFRDGRVLDHAAATAKSAGDQIYSDDMGRYQRRPGKPAFCALLRRTEAEQRSSSRSDERPSPPNGRRKARCGLMPLRTAKGPVTPRKDRWSLGQTHTADRDVITRAASRWSRRELFFAGEDRCRGGARHASRRETGQRAAKRCMTRRNESRDCPRCRRSRSLRSILRSPIRRPTKIGTSQISSTRNGRHLKRMAGSTLRASNTDT